MKKYILIALLLMFTAPMAVAGTYTIQEAQVFLNKITVNIHTEGDKQFILYRFSISFGPNTSPVKFCGAKEIIDPPGKWGNTRDDYGGDEIGLYTLLNDYGALPNGKYATLNDPNGWCDRP